MPCNQTQVFPYLYLKYLYNLPSDIICLFHDFVSFADYLSPDYHWIKAFLLLMRFLTCSRIPFSKLPKYILNLANFMQLQCTEFCLNDTALFPVFLVLLSLCHGHFTNMLLLLSLVISRRVTKGLFLSLSKCISNIPLDDHFCFWPSSDIYFFLYSLYISNLVQLIHSCGEVATASQISKTTIFTGLLLYRRSNFHLKVRMENFQTAAPVFPDSEKNTDLLEKE